MEPATPPAKAPVRGTRILRVAGLLAVLPCAAVLYGMLSPAKKAAGVCEAGVATVARLEPLIRGEVAALTPVSPPRPMPEISFRADGDTPKTLADFRGKTVLVNLWATWCVPCRKEMPALDRLQGRMGGAGFEVVAINVDTARLDRPKQFLREVAATHLPFYADPTGAVLQTAKESGPVLGLPTTFLVDPNGCALATLSGPADWASEEARKVIEAASS